MLQLQKKWKHLLSRYKMDKPQLMTHSIAYFQLLVESVTEKLITLLYKNQKEAISNAFDQLMTIIDNTVEQMTVGCIVKKMSLMHAIIHKLQNRQVAQLLIPSVHKHANSIIKEDISAILQVRPKKREDSIAKIKEFMRKLSGSKERSRSKGKMGIEEHKEKAALGEVLTKIVTPFCLYMRKVADDYQTFCRISHEEIENALIWKIVNWSKALGKIILQVNRLGLYFKEDMLSLSVYLNYLISTDISKYYDVLKDYVMKQAQKWRSQIETNNKEQKGRKQGQWRTNSQLCELKELILEWKAIKEKLYYIYGSGLLQKWVQYFPKPHKFTLFSHNDPDQADLQFILECFEPRRSKSRSRSIGRQVDWVSGQSKGEEQTKQSPVSQDQLREGSGLFEKLSENALFVNRSHGFNLTRSRLSRVQHSEKEKLMEYLVGC